MAIFEGVVNSVTSVAGDIANRLGFNFITGAIPVVPPAPIYLSMLVTGYNDGQFSTGPRTHVGTFQMNVPNHSAEYGDLAINMAQEALVLIELAVALQTISDPKGGIKIKDALDPYHYNVIKNALEENNEPVPEVANPGATTLGKLGGAITETGALSLLASGADAMRTAGYFSSFLSSTPRLATDPAGIFSSGFLSAAGSAFNLGGIAPGLPIRTNVTGFWPDYSYALNIMSAAVTVKTIVLQYIVSLIRNAIDTDAGALVLKNVMDDFSVAVSQNAIANTGRTPPDGTVQEGEEGIF